MRRISRLLALVTVAVALVVALVAAACAQKAVAVPELAITAADYSFSSQGSVPGGLTRVLLTNNGKEDHHAILVRLNDGVTLQQFEATLQRALRAAQTEGDAAFGPVFAILTFESGAPTVGPGRQGEGVVDLRPGQYAMLCFVPSPDGVPHVAKGMVKPLTVTAAPAQRPPEPKVKATVDLNDFSFAGFPKVSAGKTKLKLVNKGKEPHEMTVVRLKGIPAAQLQQILTAPPQPGAAPPSGPPPFEFVGGLNPIMPGATGWALLDLTPGEYALVCFIPSPANQGKPHVALGMFGSFAVK